MEDALSTKIPRSWRALVFATVAVGLSAGLAVFATQSKNQSKEEKKAQEKLEQAKRLEAQALVKLVDDAMTGQATQNAFSWTFAHDFIKAQDGKTYVPFSLYFDPATADGAVSLYLRVAAKGSQPPVTSKDKKKDEEVPTAYPFEDLYFADLKAAGVGKGPILQRAFAVPTGEYDVYVAVKARSANTAEAKKGAPATPVKAAVQKHAITVPDYWSGELNTSSVMIAEKVAGLAAPLTPEEQIERPYAMGMTEIIPAPDMTFTKNEALAVLFLIYNAQLTAENKPDVTVEYSFHQKAENGEKKFNSTDPQNFNAKTLPPQFDLNAGHQLVAGQEIPLATFPEGEYRLEIAVKDNVSGKTLTRDRLFKVSAS